MQVLSSVFLLIGCLFALIAAIGLIRMPDVYLRMAAATKTTSLGIGLVALGTSLHFSSWHATAVCLGVVLFIVLTSPIAAHLLARSAYNAKSQRFSKTRIEDDLPDRM